MEMKSVAAFFGKKVLREITKEQLLENICAVREKCSDRAVLRALHFFDDNERVGKEASALSEGDFDAFLSLINESGDSSFKYLQNIYASSAPNEQGLSLALYLAKQALGGEGACRVHGGGFAGTIQAFVPEKKLEAFKAEMERVFGEGSCYVLSIRPVGGVQIDLKYRSCHEKSICRLEEKAAEVAVFHLRRDNDRRTSLCFRSGKCRESVRQRALRFDIR